MTSLINGINSYYRNYAMNQINHTSLNPMSSSLKVSPASSLYSNKYFKSYDSGLSDYFNTLTKNTYLLKSFTSSSQTKNNDSSFNKKSVTTSSSNAITGTAAQKADVKDYTVNIKSLAVKQLNTGTKLISNNKASNVGLNSFKVNFGNGTSKNISYNIIGTDTNKTALDKMAKAVNSSNIGIKANVISDTKNGTSYVSLQGKTGIKNSFTLEDINGKPVDTAQANNTTTASKDAELTIDNKEYSSEDNTISLNDNKVVLSLSKAEAKDLKVSVGVDKSAVKDSITALVDNYNRLVDFSYQYSTEFSGANTLNKELGAVVNSKKASLDSIGITVSNNNTLTIDEKKLNKSLAEDFSRVRDVIAGNDGISNKLDNKANEILTNQYKYAKPLDINSNFTDLNNYFGSSSKLPYLQNVNLGFIINAIV
jgi:flagellar hook-associated protein 2